MGATVVSHGNAPPILEFGEKIFYFMTLFIGNLVIFILNLAIFARRNARRDPFFLQLVAKPVAVITAIREQILRTGQRIQNQGCPLIIA